MAKKFFRIIIIGAGFSQPAGLPLAPALWKKVLARIDRDIGTDSCVRRDLVTFLKYKEAVTGLRVSPRSIDFEEFISFLDLEHYLRLRGSDTWSLEGNETQLIIKHYIGQILWQMTPPKTELPSLYLEFARRLNGGDTIITFNYDTLLESSLEAVNQPYRLFPERFTKVGFFSSSTDMSLDEVVVLKLHGSIDWFSSSAYLELCRAMKEFGDDEVPRHPVFGRNRVVDHEPLVDGARAEADPLKRISRVRDPSVLYEGGHSLCAPYILAPSFTKVVYVDETREFWYGLGQMGSLERGMAIIGFSLPPHDEYVRQVIYRLTRNYTDNNWPVVLPDRVKTRMRLVDFRTKGHSLADFYKKYGFIDWSRADAVFDGFSEQSLDFIFTQEPGQKVGSS